MASTFVVTRSRRIAAPPERIYPLLADFTQWTRWSPWEEVDPEMSRGYSGPQSGVGAIYTWSGNRKAGQGEMRITAVDPDRSVDIDLRFTKPFTATNDLRFDLVPVAGTEDTEVTWTMVGENTLLLKLLSPVMKMDKRVGKDFEEGLSRIALVTRAAATD